MFQFGLFVQSSLNVHFKGLVVRSQKSSSMALAISNMLTLKLAPMQKMT